MYAAMAGGQPQADSLDEDLLVASWPLAGGYVRPRAATAAQDVEDVPGLTPPSWWRDDEEASQSFFGAMGVRPE